MSPEQSGQFVERKWEKILFAKRALLAFLDGKECIFLAFHAFVILTVEVIPYKTVCLHLKSRHFESGSKKTAKEDLYFF